MSPHQAKGPPSRKPILHEATKQRPYDNYLLEAAKLLEPRIREQAKWRLILLRQTADHWQQKLEREAAGDRELKRQLTFNYVNLSPPSESAANTSSAWHALFVQDVLALRHILHVSSDPIKSTIMYRHKSPDSTFEKLAGKLALKEGGKASVAFFGKHTDLSFSREKAAARKKELRAELSRLLGLLNKQQSEGANIIGPWVAALTVDVDDPKPADAKVLGRIENIVSEYNKLKTGKGIGAETYERLVACLDQIFENEEKVNSAYAGALAALPMETFKKGIFKEGELASIAKRRLELLADSPNYPSRLDCLTLLFEAAIRDVQASPQASFFYLNMLKQAFEFERFLAAKKAELGSELSGDALIRMLLETDEAQLKAAKSIAQLYKYFSPQDSLVKKSLAFCLYETLVSADDELSFATMNRLADSCEAGIGWVSNRVHVMQALRQNSELKQRLEAEFNAIRADQNSRKADCKKLEAELWALAERLPLIEREILRDELKHLVKHSEYKKDTLLPEAGALFSPEKKLDTLLELVNREESERDDRMIMLLRKNEEVVAALERARNEYWRLLVSIDKLCHEHGMLDAIGATIETEASYKHDGAIELDRYAREEDRDIETSISATPLGDMLLISATCRLSDSEQFTHTHSFPTAFGDEYDGSLLLNPTKPSVDIGYIKGIIGAQGEEDFFAKLASCINRHSARYNRVKEGVLRGDYDLLDAAEDRVWVGMVIQPKGELMPLSNHPSLLDPSNEIMERAKGQPEFKRMRKDLELYSQMAILLQLRDDIMATQTERALRKIELIHAELEALVGIMKK